MKVLFVGPGRSGKDEACDAAAKASGLVNAGTFSQYLAPYVAAELGVSVEECYARRHQDRETWFRVGNEIRRDDPTLLCRAAFTAGDISGGVRAVEEILGIVQANLADLIVWVERPGIDPDPTLKFGPEWADVVVRNDGTLFSFRDKVTRLARTWRK